MIADQIQFIRTDRIFLGLFEQTSINEIFNFTFFYKHLVYKHDQPQILGKFKHITKHAPGWDFWFEKNFWWILKKYANF